MTEIKKNTWYVLGNNLQTRFRGVGKAGWESKDLPMPFPLTYLNDGQCVESGMFYSVDHERTEDDFKTMIGKVVTKCTGNGTRVPKPFKSGLKENTVKDVIISPYTNKIAFTFVEDDSCVNCDICYLAFRPENLSTTMQIMTQPDTPEGFNKKLDILDEKYPENAELHKIIRDGFNAIMSPE
jgi:hypothetical protein